MNIIIIEDEKPAARLLQRKVEKLGLQVEYKEYPVGHGVAPQNFWDFKNWLEKI